ncbi:MAG: M56 family metallopeptidase [Gimesia sp.]|nr:M56 family metallopeptidase [Gimesia sp.]
MQFFILSPQAGLLMMNIAVASIAVGLVAVSVGLMARRLALPTRHGLFCVALVLTLVSPFAIWIASSQGLGIVPIQLGALDRTDQDVSKSDLSNDQAVGDAALPIPSAEPLTKPTDKSVVDKNRADQSSALEKKLETSDVGADTTSHDLAGAVLQGTPAFGLKKTSFEVMRSVGGVLVLVWAAVSFWFLLKLVRGLLVIRRLKSSLKPTTDPRIINAVLQALPANGHKVTAPVYESQFIPAPLTLGFWRSVIVMPVGLADSLNESELACVLAHELAHVSRHDTVIAILQQLAGIGFWWNPLLRMMNRQISKLRERICDDYVVKQLGDGFPLAEAIVKVAEWSVRRSIRIPLTTTFLEDGDEIEERITLLMKSNRRLSIRLNMKSKTLVGVFGILLAVIPLMPAVRAQEVTSQTVVPTVVASDTKSALNTAAAPPVKTKTKVEPKLKDVIEGKNRKLDKAKSAVMIARKNTITGRIVDQNKLGIGGAQVALVAYPNFQSREQDPGRVIASTTADSLGNYALTIPATEMKKPNFGAVWAKAEGYVASRSNSFTVITALARRKKSELPLAATSGTRVLVLDSAGAPVSGVRVIPRSVGVPQGVGHLLPQEWEGLATGTTGEDGKVHLPHVAPGALKELVLIPPGEMGRLQYNQNYFLNVRPAEMAPHFHLRLPETGSVKGQLVVAEGFTLPRDLQLTLHSKPRRPAGFRNIIEVPIDADGKFKVEQLMVGAIFVPAFLPEDQPLRADVAARVEVKANQETQLKIPIAPGVKVYGRIQKSDTKENVKGYKMTLIYGQTISNRASNFGLLNFDLVTDAEGRFECIVPPGPINLRLTRIVDGYSSVKSWLPREQRGVWGMKFDIPNQESFDLGTIDLVKNVRITGQVVDLKNQPLVKWSVYGFPKIPNFTQWETMNSMAGVNTDKKGIFKGRYPETYPPAFWLVSHRVWKTKYKFNDFKYAAIVISHKPFILQVDTSKEWKDRDLIPYDTVPLQESISPTEDENSTNEKN